MIQKVCWRAVLLLGQLLGGNEREALLGDLAECGITGAQALREMLGLVVRRAAAACYAPQPWFLFLFLMAPLGLIVSVLSRLVAAESAVYTWMYANNWDWDLLGIRGFWYVLLVTAGYLLLRFANLACEAWTIGFLLGAAGGRFSRVTAAMLSITLLIAETAGAPFYLTHFWRHIDVASLPASLPDPNAPVFALALYRVVFPFALQVLLVVAPALLGMHWGGRLKQQPQPLSILIWTAAIATIAMMTLHTPGFVLLLGQHVGEWIGQAQTLLAWTRYVEFWPVLYLAGIAITRWQRNSEISPAISQG